MSRAVEFDALDKGRCCSKAVKYADGCVCKYVVRCPDHGEKHVGRH